VFLDSKVAFYTRYGSISDRKRVWEEMTNNIGRQFLYNAVISRLGYSVTEIDELIEAGYLIPDTIAAIITSEKSIGDLFSGYPMNTDIASMINQLITSQQLHFVHIVKGYYSTHTSLTSEEILNYLRYTRMRAQAQQIYNELISTDLHSIAQRYRPDVQRMLGRFSRDIWTPLILVGDPFTITSNDLDGKYKCLVGIWGEWASIKLADTNGVLIHFSVSIPQGEVDLQEEDSSGNGLKWVEVKNVISLQSNWGKALIQVKNYIAQGAMYVVIGLLQQGKPGCPLPSAQRIQNLQNLQNEYPDVEFEVRTAEPTDQESWDALNKLKQRFPKIQFEIIPSTSAIPFDLPDDNWGNQLP
jgi:hypothetical protein